MNADKPQGGKCNCGAAAATAKTCKKYCTVGETSPSCVDVVAKKSMNAKLLEDSACGGIKCAKTTNVCYNPDTKMAGNDQGSICLPLATTTAATTVTTFDAIKSKTVCHIGNSVDGTNGCTCVKDKSGPCYASATLTCTDV